VLETNSLDPQQSLVSMRITFLVYSMAIGITGLRGGSVPFFGKLICVYGIVVANSLGAEC